MKYTYEATANIPPGSRRVIALFDPDAEDGWPRVLSADDREESRLEVGARYRVTIEKLREPLPEGYRWEGNEIVAPGFRWSVGIWPTGGVDRKAVFSRSGSAVPDFVVDAFRAEGLLPCRA